MLKMDSFLHPLPFHLPYDYACGAGERGRDSSRQYAQMRRRDMQVTLTPYSPSQQSVMDWALLQYDQAHEWNRYQSLHRGG